MEVTPGQDPEDMKAVWSKPALPMSTAMDLDSTAIFVREVKKRHGCACCSSYNCFEGRDYCLKGCVCDCYMTWEGRKRIKGEIEEEKRRKMEEDKEEEEERRREWAELK